MIKLRFEQFPTDHELVPDPADYLAGDDVDAFDIFTDADKIHIAANYVALHRINGIEAWFAGQMPDTFDKAYLVIFDRMVEGDYGECREDFYSGDFEIEISAHDSRDGYPHLYTF